MEIKNKKKKVELNRKVQLGTLVKMVAILGIMVLVPIAAQAGSNPNPGVLPVSSKPYGLTYGEWSAKWWQWTLSLPADHHPLFDTADCSTGQSGKVWFLGGNFTQTPIGPGIVEGKANRNCDVPVGKALFIPLINVESSPAEDNGMTEAELLANSSNIINHTTALQAEIDGVPVQNLWTYRAQSPLFTWGPLPDNNVLQAIGETFGEPISAGKTSPSVADGYYLMLAPLSAGKHIIHFSAAAKFTQEKDGFDFRFLLDITYNLNVVKQEI